MAERNRYKSLRLNEDEHNRVKSTAARIEAEGGDPSEYFRRCLLNYGNLEETLESYYGRIEELEKKIIGLDELVTKAKDGKLRAETLYEAETGLLQDMTEDRDRLAKENVELQKKVEAQQVVGEEFAKDKAFLAEQNEKLTDSIEKITKTIQDAQAQSEDNARHFTAWQTEVASLRLQLRSVQGFFGWLRWKFSRKDDSGRTAKK